LVPSVTLDVPAEWKYWESVYVGSWAAALISAEKPAKRPIVISETNVPVTLVPASLMAIALPLLLRIHAVEFMFSPFPWKFRITLKVVALAYTVL